MNDYRIRFSKEGTAKYISHLDLMRTMQRVFVRAGLKIAHSEGFNPHPRMVFAVPLSVGCESRCELMDFALLEPVDTERIPEMLNSAMPEGITVTKAYVPERKFNEIRWFSVSGRLEYDNGAPQRAEMALSEVFHASSLVIEKRTKRGIGDFDLIPCIKKISFERQSDTCVTVSALTSAQNPSMNPELLISGLRSKAPSLAPDFAVFVREETFDEKIERFR